jgi:hypothetical protein
MKCAGGMFGGKKIAMCVPSLVIIGHKCTYLGREPDKSGIAKIKVWPNPKEPTDVRSFLGVVGVLRIFIKDFAKIAKPLTLLTKKNIEFEWGPEAKEAFCELKQAICKSKAIRPLDYHCGRTIVLAVDLLNIAMGYVLLQEGADGKRYPSRFGSVTWNKVEARYSQAKVEPYGLLHVLQAC